MKPLITIKRVPTIDFMRWHRPGFVFSGLLTVLTVVLYLTVGLNYGIDFLGGTLVEARITTGPANLAEMRSKLDALGLGEVSLQEFGGTSDVLIRLPPSKEQNQAKISTALLDALGSSTQAIQLRRIEFVGPQVGKELADQGSMAAIVAFILIFFYIAVRFQRKFSLGAIAALIHDALMALGFLSAFQIEFDVTTLAAILALIGYSNNETVVIFDRVRENLIALRRMEILDVVNLSVNQTLLRSIITHLTTLLVCSALFVLGGPSVHSFSITLIVGVIVATYSSIYVSTSAAVALGVSREDLLPPKTDEHTDKMP